MPDRVFACQERDGLYIRHVNEVEPSDALRKYLEERLPPAASPIKNLDHIYSKGMRIFLVDDVGVLIKGVIEYDDMVDVHVGFWDKRLRGREAMCRTVAVQLAREESYRGVWTALPHEARATIAFAKRVGFLEIRKTRSVVVMAMLVT